MAVKLFFFAILFLLFTNCSPINFSSGKEHHPQALTIFIDGTKNDTASKTNVIKLHNLRKEDVASYYIEGVGNDGKILGLAVGAGTAWRVQKTYLYLCNNYKIGDSIFLFGFSRGAYTCRILSNLIYTAGILDFKGVKESEQKKIVKTIYLFYRTKENDADKRSDLIKNYITSWNKKHAKNNQVISQIKRVNIEAIGLWDTVEAFRWPDYKEGDFCSPHKNHLYQVCNIKKAFHAMALDDNRARLYTPILLTYKNIANCKDTVVNINNIVEEVWFSGAHADIGGGYDDDEHPEMADISLSWMISRFKPYHLFRDTIIITYTYAPIHDAQKMILMKFLARRFNRGINMYYDSTAGFYNNGRLKVHWSVLQRLKEGVAPDFKFSKKDKLDWFDKPPFWDCFDKIGNKRVYKNCNCIEIIE